MEQQSHISRDFVEILLQRLEEANPLIQVVQGPRQVGKTTGVQQLLARIQTNSHYISADSIITNPETWILEQWQRAKTLGSGTVLVIDEIQKINNWSETIKALWDREGKEKTIRPILLGSSSIQLQKGLTESLTGRFEIIQVFHWSFPEFKRAFDCNLEDYLLFGGYPASFQYVSDEKRWIDYLRLSIIETVIAQDILSIRSVSSPALFRQAFEILSAYPAQEISYTKLLGQLQNRGNTDLIKNFIHLYEQAFLFKALSKFSNKSHLTRASSPKILPLCPSLYTAQRGHTEPLDSEEKGRVFEAAVGADLVRAGFDVSYWREGNNEVDFVVKVGSKLCAVEVKSGRKQKRSGIAAFLKQYRRAVPSFINLENYFEFSQDPRKFLAQL